MTATLTERERAVLEAVIETYVQTAEPAGSRTIAKRHQLGLSPATIRNTMSDLEEKGYLYHPHTSAGRIPTDLAYRVYVDYLMRPPVVAPAQAQRIRGELEGQRDAIEAIPTGPGSSELLNILVQEAEELFDVPMAQTGGGPVHLGSTQPLTGQPEFATRAQLQGLLEVTERRDLLRDALAARGGEGLTITIGQEHADARLSTFTLVTSTYRFGPLSGVIGVMGPTRMAYDKIAALVNHTSRLVGELLE